MGPYLAAQGFGQAFGPAAITEGAIVIFQPEFNNLFSWTNCNNDSYMVDCTAGHVAIVDSYQYNHDGTLTVTLRGANQPGNGAHTEANCNNVTLWTITYPAYSDTVSYWTR